MQKHEVTTYQVICVAKYQCTYEKTTVMYAQTTFSLQSLTPSAVDLENVYVESFNREFLCTYFNGNRRQFAENLPKTGREFSGNVMKISIVGFSSDFHRNIFYIP